MRLYDSKVYVSASTAPRLENYCLLGKLMV